MSFMLRVQGVSKRYGSGANAIQALTDVTLDVPAGQFLCITGPSGSGKSTLLHLIAGLDAPSAGRVIVGGQDLTALSEGVGITGPQFAWAVAVPRAVLICSSVGLQPRVDVVPVAVITGACVLAVQVTVRETGNAAFPQASETFQVLV